jgi:hypothetical protein
LKYIYIYICSLFHVQVEGGCFNEISQLTVVKFP